MIYEEAKDNTINAVKKDGYTHILYKDSNDEYCITAKYKGCIRKWDFKKIIMTAQPTWVNGILKVKIKNY